MLEFVLHYFELVEELVLQETLLNLENLVMSFDCILYLHYYVHEFHFHPHSSLT